MGAIGKPSPPMEEMSAAPLYANRVRVYPKAVHGPVRRFKWAVLCFCLGIYYILPWVRWGRGPGRPDQAVLLDLTNERFYFFNLKLWPQDIYILTGLLIAGAVALFLVTSVGGRVWCGYSCPQTVWTDLFMQVERWIEGDRAERMKLDRGKRDGRYLLKKTAKHATWLAIAFWTGGAWIMYYVDAPQLVRTFWTGTASSSVYLFVGLFTATTYLLAGWAREQVCTYMCPWPRFQSAMLDEQSLIVTYETQRGEPRSRHLKRAEPGVAGDCIDCGGCVAACPTGIDIRDGLQLECINCALCVDACNAVMDQIGRKRGLITWDTLAGQKARAEGRSWKLRLIRPRTVIYATALSLACAALILGLISRTTIGMTVEHDRAPLFVPLPDGSVRNAYTIRIANKTDASSLYRLSFDHISGGRMVVAESGDAAGDSVSLRLPADSVSTFRILVTGPVGAEGDQTFAFTLRSPGNEVSVKRTAHFLTSPITGVVP